MSFYNPYNFVPAPPRGAGLPSGLANGAPAGHHRWHKALWSGRIGVTVTTVSPLLVVENSETDQAAAPELRVPLVDDPDGTKRVDIAPTQLKGMLRTAYEAVTNSRFGIVSRAHGNRLHYRSSASSGSGLLPVVVEHTTTGPCLHVGGTLNVPGLESLPGAVLEAWDHHGDNVRVPSPLLAGTLTGRGPLAHGQYVDAVVEQRTIEVRGTGGNTREMARWHVVDAVPHGVVPPGGLSTAHAGRRWARMTGYLHVTGPTIKGKRYERLFLDTRVASHPDVTFDPPNMVTADAAELLADLQALIDDQRAAHRVARKDGIWHRTDTAARPWDYFGHEPGHTAWARHLYDAAEPPDTVPQGTVPPPWVGVDLSPLAPPPATTTSRFTCWAETERGQMTLRPVMISRFPHLHSPLKLLDESLRPATALADLSPADRVFGWVDPSGPDGLGDEGSDAGEPAPAASSAGAARSAARRAHRGQLRVVRVCGPAADAVETMPAPVVLPVLSMPKPTQGRFYLGKKGPGGIPEPLEHGTTRAGFFQQNHVWRGRKTYLYQRGDHGQQPGRAPSGVAYPAEPGTQSSVLREWVRPKTRFTFDILVDNLSDTELGALLWLLDPERLGGGPDPASPKAGRMRLGLGKPHGFGVVEVRLAPERTRLATGEQVARRLIDLTGDRPDLKGERPGEPQWIDLAAKFETDVGADLAPVLAAVRAAALGVSGPVHYPRQKPDGVDHGYEWFVENERAAQKRKKFNDDGKKNGKKPGVRAPKEDRSLPVLHGDGRMSLDPIVIVEDW